MLPFVVAKFPEIAYDFPVAIPKRSRNMAKKPKAPKASAAHQAVNKASGKKQKRKKGTAAAVAAVALTLVIVAFVGLYAYGSQLEGSKVRI